MIIVYFDNENLKSTLINSGIRIMTRTTAFGIYEIESEIKKLSTFIKEYEKLLKSKKELFKVIVRKLIKIKDKFSVKRRTKITNAILNYNIEQHTCKQRIESLVLIME